ncbi:MAG TPA: glycosyltransferase [Anaerolineae bacterium]|nr:glycosyltransferase [Anaerolineae bacterium]
MKVSLIVTVLNEKNAIERLLQSLESQSRPPDEVVISDGGSTDGTLTILSAWASAGWLPLRILKKPGANISEGRNAAIAAATGDVIATTDAGVRLERDWLEKIVAPFESKDSEHFVPVVAGWFVADPQTAFEAAMGATVLPHVREINPKTFLPSSRSIAFRKVAWEASGGYPEWLDYCEDLVFDMRLRDFYGPFPFAPEAVVHFRPRTDLPAFFKQYYLYARGDGKADLWRKRHAIRYLTYLLAGPLLVALALFHSPWWWLALLAGAIAYTATPYRRLWPLLTPYGFLGRIRAVLLVPLIRVVGDVAKMLGYPGGLLWRWRNLHRPEVHWRNYRLTAFSDQPTARYG